jgi:hypothetical protein
MSVDGCIHCISDRLLEGCSALCKPGNQLGLNEAPQPPFPFAERVCGYLTKARPTHKSSAIHSENLCCFISVQEVFTVFVHGV